MKNNENNYSNVSPSMSSSSNIPVAISPCGWKVSPSVSSSSNIPVAMSPRGWKVSSTILLGSARPVPCAKRCMRCSSWLYKAVLSKISLQLLHLKVQDCCPHHDPDWTLLSHGCKDTGRMIKSALEVCTYRVSIRQFSKVLVSSHSVAIMIICKDIKSSSTILQKSFQRSCKENDQIK